MKLRDLEVFDAVVAAGSIQGAADAVGLTQSAVTRAIQRLETDLGAPLLERASRPVTLTRDGARAHAHACDVLAAAARLRRAFADRRAPAGPFRLGVSHAIASLVLRQGEMLGLDAFPDLRPSVTTGWSGELLEALGRRQLDAALVALRAPPAEVGAAQTLSLGRAEVVVIGAAAADPGPIDLPAANALGWALNLEGCGYRRALTAALADRGVAPNIVLETNSLELQLRLAGRGRALTLAPALPDALDLARHGAAPRAVDGFRAEIGVSLIVADGLIGVDPVLERLAGAARAALGDELQNTHTK